MRTLAAIVILASLASNCFASSGTMMVFDNIELIQPEGDDMRETSVRVVFDERSMRFVARSNGTVLKEWSYESIKSAEYSYSKNPRWKTGVGLAAAGMLFPPLLLVAIPIGFTKHRRHWVTIRTENDFAVLKVGKGIRKIFMPAFETKASIPINGVGEDK
jgi:hypothetical protein